MAEDPHAWDSDLRVLTYLLTLLTYTNEYFTNLLTTYLLTDLLTYLPLGRGAYDPRCRPRRAAALS